MHNILLMQEFESEQCLSDDLNRFFFRERSLEESRVKIFAFEMLLDDKEVLPVLENVVHSDDVRVTSIH